MKVFLSFFVLCLFNVLQNCNAQNVGIGTTTPLTKLHVSFGPSGFNSTAYSPFLVEGNTNTYIGLLSPNTSETAVLFGKAENAASGGIIYNNVNALNGFQFRTNGNLTKMVLNNNGNLGIGDFTPSARLSVSLTGSELAGNVASNAFKTNAGFLGTTIGSELSIASIGFMSGNNSSLGIKGYRNNAGTDWTSTALLLGYDVDNTVRASGAFLTFNALGNMGIGTTNPASSAVFDVNSSSKGFLPPRMTLAQRNAISSPAEGLIIYNTTSKTLEFYNGTSWFGTTHYIGESYGGGIVFYVYENGQHGLIASTADQGVGGQWYNGGTYLITNAIRDGIGANSYNTEHIIATLGTGNYAAMVAAKYNGNGYGDWYLPSKYELNLLYLKKDIVGGFDNNTPYWSSSEYSSTHAWNQNFGTGLQDFIGKNFGGYVRAIRAF